jgi:signal transduction histidine kinase
VLGQWLDMLVPAERERAQAFISLAAVSGGIQRDVLSVVTSAGDSRQIEFVTRAQPTRERTRTPLLVGVCRDITEERALERLRQEMAETRESNRGKSELLSRISHELRTPLNGILGFAQLLEGSRISAQLKQQGSRSDGQVERDQRLEAADRQNQQGNG